MSAKLFDFQLPVAEAVGETTFSKGSAMLTCGTGFGKTFQGSHIAREAAKYGIKTVVICPKIAIYNWQRVLASFDVHDADVLNYESAVRRYVTWANIPTRGKKVLKWPTWKPEFHGRLVIFDESHRCGGQDTLNCKLMISSREANMKSIQMTATPADSPLRMRGIMTTLGITTWTSFWTWARQHGCFENHWNGLDFTKGPKGKEHMAKISEVLYPEYGQLVTLDQVAEHFNEHHVVVDCPFVKGAEQAYYEAEKEMYELAAEKGVDPEKLKLGCRVKARRAVELLKVPTFVELAKDAMGSGYSVPIFMNFTDPLLKLAEELKSPAIYGGDTAEGRQAAIDAFQAGDLRCLVINIAAGAESISLHDLVGDKPRLSIISPCEDSTKLKQVLGRVHRVGAKSPATSKLVYAADSLEEKVAKNVSRKLANLGALTREDLEFF